MFARIAGEKQHGAFQVIVVADPLQWHPLRQLFHSGCRNDLLCHFRRKHSGRQCIDSNTVASPTTRQSPREIDNRSLARVVSDGLYLACTATKASDRREIDDTAVLVGNHRALADLLAEQEQRTDIQIHHLVPGVDRVIFGGRPPSRASVVARLQTSPIACPKKCEVIDVPIIRALRNVRR